MQNKHKIFFEKLAALCAEFEVSHLGSESSGTTFDMRFRDYDEYYNIDYVDNWVGNEEGLTVSCWNREQEDFGMKKVVRKKKIKTSKE